MSRRLLLALSAVVVALLLVAVTWLAASRFQSPAQRAAQAQPPAAEPVLVPVAKADLTERTTINATVGVSQTRSIDLVSPGAGAVVVTAAGAAAGSQIESGQAVVWLNDRPVMALPGAFPLYRDLGPGDTGSDVRLLQEALTGLGYGLSVDGQFGAATTRAVAKLYQRVGADAPTRPVDDRDRTNSLPSEGQAPGPGASASDETDRDRATQPESVQTTGRSEIYLPASEVVVIAGLPVRVESVPSVGTTLTAATARLTVSTGQTVLSAQVTGALAARVTQQISGTAQLGDETLSVSVSSIESAQTDTDRGSPSEENTADDPAAETAPMAGAAGERTLILTPTSAQIPQEWIGRGDVLVTLDLIEPLLGVLTVPQRALASDASGSTSVLLHETDGSFTQVRVTQQACVAGTCAIEADAGSGVREGAYVRVDRP
ncbi:peptidoglycan-binding domain-containing protein [Actinomyces urogenitalis]|uniref:peptidoglycan-binding domain-containing protein n=1 Tax=Actinomyces urogenitalis TaxID=103621 RepID=UPI003C6C3EE7